MPDLVVFTTPKLDKAIVDQVPFNLKKSVEIRDKELLKVQRHVLNVAAPLMALHDLLENKQAVAVADTLGIVEKALCLLGNASNSLSVLRRHKVLYAINPKKVSLAEASHPNAGKQLFGNDISKIASDSADILRNLQKNLSQSRILFQLIDSNLVNISKKTTDFSRTSPGTNGYLQQKRDCFGQTHGDSATTPINQSPSTFYANWQNFDN